MSGHRPPYVTVGRTQSCFVPVLYMPNRQGEYQASDTRPVEDDETTAKRVAVAWANEMNVEYRPPGATVLPPPIKILGNP